MKFNKLGRNALLATLSLGLASTVACTRDFVCAFVYVPSAQGSLVSAYAIDYQTGIPNQVSGSPFPTNLHNPITAIASPSGTTLYVIGGSFDNAVESYSIGTDGKLYGLNTPNITGTYPTAAAIDSQGKFLYVTYTYETKAYNGTGSDYSPVNKGPGGVSIFPINADGSLGTPTNVNVGNNPTGITLTVPVSTTTPANEVFAYVVDQEVVPNATILEFQQNTSTGALTLMTGSYCPPTAPSKCGIHAGVTPFKIAAEPTGRFVYATDSTANQVLGFQLLSSGLLIALPTSPFTTGLYPEGLTIDPRGKYLYTANYNANTVSSFAINHADGSLGGTATGSFSTATAPTCVTIENSVGIYLFTSNFLDNSISGAQLSPNTGELKAIANTPFPSSPAPACLTAVANGAHAQSIVNPN